MGVFDIAYALLVGLLWLLPVIAYQFYVYLNWRKKQQGVIENLDFWSFSWVYTRPRYWGIGWFVCLFIQIIWMAILSELT